ncbi:MAG TPA: hypothetical protein VN838_14375 [Bradyrhizobium sp.]|nr:hypothetical protein [Bradyrhizobium sp.]
MRSEDLEFGNDEPVSINGVAGGAYMRQMRAPMMIERVYEPATMTVST